MEKNEKPSSCSGRTLGETASLKPEKHLVSVGRRDLGDNRPDRPVLIVLAAGKGTRFGKAPKCIQPVHGAPLASHSIDSFLQCWQESPVICVVGYRHEEVCAALGRDKLYVFSDNPAGGTAYAAFESFCLPELLIQNPLVFVTMGDRVVPSAVFRQLWDRHCSEEGESDLSFLAAEYEPPRNFGKGRVVRDASGRVLRIVEERDIAAETDDRVRAALSELTEGNCPLYLMRARTLHESLRGLSNDNAQGQFYLTDIVETLSSGGGEIRTLTTRVSDPEYDLLCSDVTRPMDLALLEGLLASAGLSETQDDVEAAGAAKAIAVRRPKAQSLAIVRQIEELLSTTCGEKLGFVSDEPVGLGLAGGRLRLAFMHPDMQRFLGPAWQMPIGAGSEDGSEQIVVLMQKAADHCLLLCPTSHQFRESVNRISADSEILYPREEVSDLQSYERFGTRMSEQLLLSLGYFSEDEIERRRKLGLPLPPPSRWISNSMKRPFSLICNAIASIRSYRTGTLGARIQRALGKQYFEGLRIVSTGSIPQGGFSSSSAVTVAAKNAINALFDLALPPDLLIHLACQAEYGTGVRGGSLDQATEQKGEAGKGALISSSPRDNYRVYGTFPVPADRFRILFPYSVERDRAAWAWSWGVYAEKPGSENLTAGEMRKMTGKAAEIAAILLELPLDTDFFMRVQDSLLADGELSDEDKEWVTTILRAIPLRASQSELKTLLAARKQWFSAQMETMNLTREQAELRAESVLSSLLDGWHDPVLKRTAESGEVLTERGAPLRAMLAYLFGETAKNFHLIHHQEDWIACVQASQRGDRSFDIDPDSLPDRASLEKILPWEAASQPGPERLELWLREVGATPFDFNRDLDDASLSAGPIDLLRMRGSNFFRGLALLDLAEAMLLRAFGRDAVAARVNAAGQGDYFQVHVDTKKAETEDVKSFLRSAFYSRFGLNPDPEFVEVYPGGGAVGLKLSRFDLLPRVAEKLREFCAQ